MPHSTRKAKPTFADKDAARRLKAIWLAIPPEKRVTQEELAERWTKVWREEISQSAISQYLNGHLPLSATTVLRFATILKCEPAAIRADLPELNSSLRGALLADDVIAVELAGIWGQLTDDIKEKILAFATISVATGGVLKKDYAHGRD